ncbi:MULTISPECIES: ParB/RepB/Spo0J family partition protein [unclassified Sphingobium]|uniref:ParB/RepB/Spo0J family partition protein n=1 Tax=unclassified Sphingobium TaxID=2611147 RepID=UPI0005CBEE7B|nr:MULTISPECIES: ParB/RepB/Spo0J family partition protein [unclassified Sphingobium]AJR26970.1 chromosome partitioning protein ParB [Sphingobium sp. YBL2]QPI75342.1 ParB/RepB/Spo0J family partition protein [Sphingobium sp. Cam5-1]UZW58000.1 ParB/RepB/Spo0J family partition protein [Sphingobium sp. JS3065]
MAGFMKDILETLSYDPAPMRQVAAREDALSRLDQRLANVAGAGSDGRTTIRIQPGECVVWDGNPRDQPGLTAESCQSLIESIAQEGGNRIPVLVRMNGADVDRPYELIVGSRRRFAIDWLNHNGRPELRLTALVVDLSDEEAFRLADIENRERADITELDRARSYQAAVDRFYGGVQSRMANALNLSNSQLSRLLALALLPEEIVDAFGTRAELRVRHSEVLTPLLKRVEQRMRMLAEARRISAEQQERSVQGDRLLAPATVLARLRESVASPGQDEPRDIEIIAGGERVGRAKPARGGGVQIDLNVTEETDLDELLSRLRATIVAARAGGGGEGEQVASEEAAA